MSGKLFSGIKSYLEEDEVLFAGSALESVEIADFDNSLPNMSRIPEYEDRAHNEEDSPLNETRSKRRIFGNRIGQVEELHADLM
ncbi:MAG: hypothetical protein IJH57_01635, partial [Mogibacterium sp.]|nr:hypothetical protein [Mogibacterium sp.]